MITNDIPPHPVLKCRCAEGRVVEGDEVRYMPPVHDCLYILERNNCLDVRVAQVTHAA